MYNQKSSSLIISITIPIEVVLIGECYLFYLTVYEDYEKGPE